MSYLADIPTWALALLIFCLRIIDVTLGTVRTITVVRGYIALSVVLGFFEVLVWITAISQVVVNLGSNPYLALAYSLGFAAGNATGIWVERKLCIGKVVLQLLTNGRSDEIAAYLRARGNWAVAFVGKEINGRGTMIFAICRKRDLKTIIEFAKKCDDGVVYVVEPLLESGPVPRQPLPFATGWSSALPRK